MGFAATAFGLVWHSDIRLSHFASCVDPAPSAADVYVRLVGDLPGRSQGVPVNRGLVYSDGFRFQWNNVACFDFCDGGRLDVQPLADWTGDLPWPFYSTVAALICAWHGALPVHACAVALDNRAVIIAGPSGAGKSTLCAALVARGARLISDDLTVLRAAPAGPGAVALPGRPGIRLFKEIAHGLHAPSALPIAHDPRDKVNAHWPGSLADESLPVAAIVLLQSIPVPIQPQARTALIKQHRFRRKWLSQLPHARERTMIEARLAMAVNITTAPPLGPFDCDRIDECLARVYAALPGPA